MNNYKRWVIYTAALFLTISAALVSGSHLYFMAGILLMLPLVSYLLGMVSLRDLSISRETPGSGWDGETATFHFVVTSRSPLPRLFLQARDHLPEWIQPEEAEPKLFNASPRGVTRVPYRVQLSKRGAYNLEWITLTALDPLGIFSFSKRVSAPCEFLVYPVPQPISELVMSGAERYGFRDLPIAAARGSGVDPDGVREYVPGDPLRRMHWKSTARTGKLSVIEFEESRAVNVILALDLFRGAHTGSGKDSTLEYLIRAAASMAQVAVRQGASVRLVTDDAISAADYAGRGSEHLYIVLGGLARAEARETEALSHTLVRRVGQLAPGTTLVVLTSGMDQELPRALSHYTLGGAQAVVLYADPRGFTGNNNRAPTADGIRELMEGFYAVNSTPFVIERTEDYQLKPEIAQNGHYA